MRVWDLDLGSTQAPWLAGDFVYVLTTRGEVVCLPGVALSAAHERQGGIRFEVEAV